MFSDSNGKNSDNNNGNNGQKAVSIFGVTGSVGKSAKDVIMSAKNSFAVKTVTANNNVENLAKYAVELGAENAVIANEKLLPKLKNIISESGADIKAFGGRGALIEKASENCDLLLAAIMGFDGLRPIIAALESGVNVAIANKEPLVAAGGIVMEAARKSGAKILPVDSEHNAIFQVLEENNRNYVEKITLTASGGPFLDWDIEQMSKATPQEAVAHPNWDMGAKISVDSATMMNKALEIIEAHYLFDMPADKIEVIIHPQSVVHSMVFYQDGTVLAQMGNSDMCIPIAYALAWPERMSINKPPLDLASISSLSFRKPDFEKFPALALAYNCLNKSPNDKVISCVTMNAANEIAVRAFLDSEIGFSNIMECIFFALREIECSMSAHNADHNIGNVQNIDEIEKLDKFARKVTSRFISSKCCKLSL